MHRTIAVLFLLLLCPVPQASHVIAQSTDRLAPTAYAALPTRLDDLWLVPRGERRPRSGAVQALKEAVIEYGAGDFARAFSLVSRPALAGSEVRDYAAYYKGLCELKLSRAGDARVTFAGVRKRNPKGYVAIAVTVGEAEAAEALGDAPAAVSLYEKLAEDKTTINEEILSKLGRAALAAGDRKKAAEAFLRVFYEFALTEAAIAAGQQLESLRDLIVRTDYKADLGRAAMLFGARRYADAREAFAAIQSEVSGDDRELVELRIAESDYFLGHHQAALNRLQPWLERAARRAEARFYSLSALRALGRDDE
jgi:hypothetical protein